MEALSKDFERFAMDLEMVAQSGEGMGEAESAIARSTLEIQRLALEKASQAKSDACAPNCPRCGRPLQKLSQGHAREVDSRFGRIVVKRAYGWCARCKEWFHPADMMLGLEKRAAASPSLQEAMALLVSKMPVSEAALVMERLTGIAVDRSTMDREARRQGERAERLNEEMDKKALDTQGRWEVAREVKKDLPPGVFTLVIMMDALMIRERDDWGLTAELMARGEKPKRWHWVYAGTVFRLQDRVEKAGGRAMILSRGYVVTRHGIEALSRRIFAEAVRQGLLSTPDVLVISDGGVWIWNIIQDRFPWARKRLDFYHAAQHLWAVANHVHGEGSAEAKAWVEPLLHQLRHGGEAGVIQTLEELQSVVQEALRQAVERETNYFKSHREHLDYQKARDRAEPIGSGAMESVCRQYQCRFKRPGQFWSLEGDEALLTLETFWRNGRWKKLFPHAQPMDSTRN